MRAAILALALSVVPGCFDTFCTAILRWGITVDVTGPGGAPVDATVTLRDGSYVEVITPDQRLDTVYSGAGERAGEYDVTIEAQGFQTVMMENIEVDEDGCHVETEKLVVELEPSRSGI